MMQGFETERLRMRPLDARDEALYCALYTDPDTMRFICPPLSAERARRSFCRVILRPRPAEGPFLFSIVAKHGEGVLGLCATSHVDLAGTRAEVGVMLQSGARGQGYAREALAGMVASTFREHPAVGTVWVQCSALNPLVERMVSSIGFQLDRPGATGDGSLAQRIWSVQRLSWCSTNQQGEVNVECHQVS
jgi:RimJ/RimL family protein N-acetyltransferase